jgi:hypothetical protein
MFVSLDEAVRGVQDVVRVVLVDLTTGERAVVAEGYLAGARAVVRVPRVEGVLERGTLKAEAEGNCTFLMNVGAARRAARPRTTTRGGRASGAGQAQGRMTGLALAPFFVDKGTAVVGVEVAGALLPVYGRAVGGDLGDTLGGAVGAAAQLRLLVDAATAVLVALNDRELLALGVRHGGINEHSVLCSPPPQQQQQTETRPPLFTLGDYGAATFGQPPGAAAHDLADLGRMLKRCVPLPHPPDDDDAPITSILSEFADKLEAGDYSSAMQALGGCHIIQKAVEYNDAMRRIRTRKTTASHAAQPRQTPAAPPQQPGQPPSRPATARAAALSRAATARAAPSSRAATALAAPSRPATARAAPSRPATARAAPSSRAATALAAPSSRAATARAAPSSRAATAPSSRPATALAAPSRAATSRAAPSSRPPTALAAPSRAATSRVAPSHAATALAAPSRAATSRAAPGRPPATARAAPSRPPATARAAAGASPSLLFDTGVIGGTRSVRGPLGVVEMPNSFFCPASGVLMALPVITPSGRTYEYSSLGCDAAHASAASAACRDVRVNAALMHAINAFRYESPCEPEAWAARVPSVFLCPRTRRVMRWPMAILGGGPAPRPGEAAVTVEHAALRGASEARRAVPNLALKAAIDVFAECRTRARRAAAAAAAAAGRGRAPPTRAPPTVARAVAAAAAVCSCDPGQPESEEPLLDPILQEVADDAVITAYGQTYSARGLDGWLRTGSTSDPIVRRPLDARLPPRPNEAVRRAVAWHQTQRCDPRAATWQLCPISGETMRDPVVLADGSSCELRALQARRPDVVLGTAWLAMRDKPPADSVVFRNYALANAIREYCGEPAAPAARSGRAAQSVAPK